MFCFKNYLEIVQLHKAVVLISLTKSDESCRLFSRKMLLCSVSRQVESPQHIINMFNKAL